MRILNYLFVFFIFLFSCLTIHQARKNAISYFATEYSGKIKLSYQFALKSIGNIADIFYRDYEEPISRAFDAYADAKGDERLKIREQLLDSYMPFFENHKDMGLSILHFHLSDGSSFIRFHQPDTYGDQLFGVRESVRIANEEKRFVSGFEEGKITHAFRYVYPIFYDARHLGSMELTFDFSAIKREMMKKSGSREIILLMDKEVVKTVTFKKNYDTYQPCSINDNFMVKTDSKDLVAALDDIHALIADDLPAIRQQMKKYLPFTRVFKENGGFVIVHFMVLNNVRGKHVGYIIAASDTIQAPGLHYTFYFKILFGAVLFISFMLYWNNRINNLNVELAAKTKELRKLSNTDSLTAQYNRRQCERVMHNEFVRAKRYDSTFTFLLLDIDRFKSVNDTYGHQRGDAVLVRFCSLIKENIRSIDTLGRWGGEEFIVICPETDLGGGLGIAENIRKLVAGYDFSEVGRVTTSIGVACYQAEDSGYEEILKRADVALYRAKTRGRNRVESMVDKDVTFDRNT